MRSTSTATGGRAVSSDDPWAVHLEKIARGDEAAFARLYDESSPFVFGVILRMLADQADAEEVTLDVYHEVWRKAVSFDSRRGQAAGWLMMLARSRAIDHIRSRAARRRTEQSLPDGLPDGGAAGDPGGAGQVEPQRQAVKQALATLRPEQRELIELAFYSGYSQSELASRLGLPLGTVKTRMRRAMTKLRDLLVRAPQPLSGCVSGDGAANA
jgi:RNA polymerase sigma-70 factor (ECF subfamily)